MEQQRIQELERQLCKVEREKEILKKPPLSQRHQVDSERERLKAKVVQLHDQSRGAAGANTQSSLLKAQGERIGRYKASRLMAKFGIECQ